MVLFCSLIGIIAGLLFFLSREKGMSIIEGAVYALSGYVLSYIFSSASLLCFDVFSVKRTTLVCMVLWIVLALVSWIKGNRAAPVFDIKPFLIPIVVAIIGIPFVMLTPFEYFAMGQDEGVYQTEAIMYIRDHNHKQFNFEEYQVANTEEFKEHVIDYVTPNNILGTFYYNEINMEMILTGENTHSLGPNTLIFHGLHTISAMLAWWGTMFGIRNMVGVNCLMYILSIFWVHLICRRLKIGRIGNAVACVVFMISPLAIWVSKSALTEAGTTLLWLIIIYLLFSEKKNEILLSGVIIGVYGLYHVSIYVYLPLFVFLYIALCLYTANKEYIKAMIVAVSTYFISFVTDLVNATGYTLMNYRKIYKGPINRENIIWVMTFVCVLLLVIGVVMLRIKIRKVKFNARVIAWLVRALQVYLMIISVYRIYKDMPPFKFSAYLTIISMAIVTGVVLPLVIFFSFMFRTDKWTDNKNHLVLLVIFVYCIVFYSAYMMPTIPEYYYFARYFAMFIPLICIMGGLCVERLKRPIGIVVGVVTVAILLPPSIFLLNNKDDTRVQWDSLDEIEETIQFCEPDAIVMQRDMYMLFYYEFKSLGVPVYPIDDDFETEIKCLEDHYDNIYIFDYTFDERFEQNCEVERRFMNLDTQDHGQYLTRWFLLPYDVSFNRQTITIYRWENGTVIEKDNESDL